MRPMVLVCLLGLAYTSICCGIYMIAHPDPLVCHGQPMQPGSLSIFGHHTAEWRATGDDKDHTITLYRCPVCGRLEGYAK